MLVLSRKVGERVVIGNGIVVVVKRVSGQRVTFGIEAPNDVKIIRGELELYEKPHAMTPFAPELEAHAAVTAKPR
jgi:carbon storage regulator